MANYNEWDLLRLADHLSLAEAACCIINVPARYLGSNRSIKPYIDDLYGYMDWDNPSRSDADVYHEFSAALSALTKAVKTKRLPAETVVTGKYVHVRYNGNESEGFWEPIDEINQWETLVDVEDLKRWLESKGFRPKFFFGERQIDTPYLDQSHRRFAPKLAAAVRVWIAMEDENLRQGKSVLESNKQWLTANYKDLGLTHRRDNPVNRTKIGDINKSAVDEAAKIANWDQDGGAPATPIKKPPSP
ncbi:hypothetical protein JOE11_005060 [Robbsia andropogonis]|uniref:hypothetical protein n=1 Tax=Robbsia andropogonis TaxID=28092 RepID=UPI003D1D3880